MTAVWRVKVVFVADVDVGNVWPRLRRLRPELKAVLFGSVLQYVKKLSIVKINVYVI